MRHAFGRVRFLVRQCVALPAPSQLSTLAYAAVLFRLRRSGIGDLPQGGLSVSFDPRVTLTGLAKFMMASSSQQRKILLNYKYPKPEGSAQAKYYRDTYRILHSFHSRGHNVSWLLAQADFLAATPAAVDRSAHRIDRNVAAIRRYAKYFGSRSLHSHKETPRLTISYAGLLIKATSDVFASESRFDRLIKYQFAQSDDPRQHAKILCQVMLEAAQQAGLSLRSSAIRVWDCQTGHEYQLARVGARLKSDIEASCQAIVALWPTL